MTTDVQARGPDSDPDTDTTAADGGSVIIFCPSCGSRFVVDKQSIAHIGDVMMLCTGCGRGTLLGQDEREQAAPTIDASGVVLEEASWPRVVVGHEVPAAARSIADALRRGHFAPVCVRSGDAVLAAVDPAMPEPAAAIVLDVGIPGVLAFEIVEGLRRHPELAKVPVVLLASVYEKTRYKRRPNRLYGADAYLELHHVPDRLVEVLTNLMHARPVGDERNQAPVDRARATSLRAEPAFVDGARVLARRLLSDVALYHGDEIARGVRDGDPFAGVLEAVDAARVLHARAGGTPSVFAEELDAFARRLADARGLTGRFLG